MKFILVPILMILTLTQAFSKWMVVIEYNLNKEYISKNLCINRAKPKIHCNGKCQMMKKMAEEEKQNSTGNTNHTSKISIQDIVFNEEPLKPGLCPLLTLSTVYNEYPPIAKHKTPVTSIFHPPALS